MEHPVAIIGAGVSGLACARVLADTGIPVVVFEKSRGPGGRMSTRRSDSGATFDHGAQYLTVRGHDFQTEADLWRSQGSLNAWNVTPAVVPPGSSGSSRRAAIPSSAPALRLVGTPGMNAPLKTLAHGIECRYGVRVGDIEASSHQVSLRDDNGAVLGVFRGLVCSAPAPQARDLLSFAAPDVSSLAETAKMAPCWAAMYEFASPLGVESPAIFVNEGPVAWASRNASKPGRPSHETWVVHASASWSREHLEGSTESVLVELTSAFERVASKIGHRGFLEPVQSMAHRWRFALVEQAVGVPCVVSPTKPIVACGDWCVGPRIEDAWRSGRSAADSILRMLG